MVNIFWLICFYCHCELACGELGNPRVVGHHPTNFAKQPPYDNLYQALCQDYNIKYTHKSVLYMEPGATTPKSHNGVKRWKNSAKPGLMS